MKFNRDNFSDVTLSKMKKIYFILLSVSLWDTCNCVANYVVAREGDNVSISFNITSEVTLFGKEGTNIFKLKDMKLLRVYDNSYKERVQYDANQTAAGGLFSFTLLNVTSSDAGQLKRTTIDETKECLLLVISREPTQPVVEGDSRSPVAGSQMTLTCNSTSRSLPSDHPLVMEYRWEKNGNDFKTHANLPKFTLNVRKADRGDNYRCQAYEEGLISPWSLVFTLQPQYGPDSIQVSPTSLLEGEHITCSADCNPGCNITLSGQDGQVTTGQVGFNMDRGQSGIYCTAWNVHGNKSRSVDVSVLSTESAVTSFDLIGVQNVDYPPELSCEDGNKTTHEGGSLSLTGLVRSNPQPNVTIHSPNGTGLPMKTQEYTHDNNYKISYTIDSAKCDDHGLYEITAENQYGSSHLSVAVMVLCSPRLVHKPKPVKTTDDNTWTFMIQAYPQPALEAIFSMSPGRDTKVISLFHKLISNERQAEDGLTTQSNLHEFHVIFPCESLGQKFLLTFINPNGKKNISFILEEDHCKAPADATLVIMVVNIAIVLVLINITTVLLIYIRRKRAGPR